MEYFQVRYDSRVVNYERKMFIRLATGGKCYITLFSASVAPTIVNYGNLKDNEKLQGKV